MNPCDSLFKYKLNVCESVWFFESSFVLSVDSFLILVNLCDTYVNPCQCLWLSWDSLWIHVNVYDSYVILFESLADCCGYLRIITCQDIIDLSHCMNLCEYSYEFFWTFVLNLCMNHNFDIKNPFFLSLSLYVCVCVYEYIALGSERQTLHKHIWICWVFESWELMLVFVNVYKSLYECMWICVILCANNLNLASSMQKYANVWPNICKCM